MSKRLQVLLDERDLAEIRGLAQRERLTVADWVRRALDARGDQPQRCGWPSPSLTKFARSPTTWSRLQVVQVSPPSGSVDAKLLPSYPLDAT